MDAFLSFPTLKILTYDNKRRQRQHLEGEFIIIIICLTRWWIQNFVIIFVKKLVIRWNILIKHFLFRWISQPHILILKSHAKNTYLSILILYWYLKVQRISNVHWISLSKFLCNSYESYIKFVFLYYKLKLLGGGNSIAN